MCYCSARVTASTDSSRRVRRRASGDPASLGGRGTCRNAVGWSGASLRLHVLDALIGQADEERPRREALYVRVSGTTGQESSLVAQEEELRATATAEVVTAGWLHVFGGHVRWPD